MTANFLINFNLSFVESVVEEEKEFSVYGGEFSIRTHLEEVKESFHEGSEVSNLDMNVWLKFF